MHLIMCMQANKHSNRALFFFYFKGRFLPSKLGIETPDSHTYRLRFDSRKRSLRRNPQKCSKEDKKSIYLMLKRWCAKMFKRGCANISNFQKLSHPALRFAFRMNVGLKLFETFTLESFRNYTIFTYVSTQPQSFYFRSGSVTQNFIQTRQEWQIEIHWALGWSIVCSYWNSLVITSFFGFQMYQLMRSSSKGSSRALCPGNQTRYRASGGSS